VAVEVAANEVVDLLLGLLVQVLELVDSGKFGDIQPVRQDTVRLALEQVLAFIGSDVGDGGEDVTRVGRRPLDAVPVVDTALAGLSINVEVLQVVVEVDRAGAQIPTQQCCMSCEDGGHINGTLPDQRQRNTGKPLVEVRNDCPLLLMADELQLC